ncbi:MAG: hypothetical protein KGD63_13310 [Candidatus Lokiarchaeota archaeon]|nr:hypothetical protein [Candidatus Lokiarchaeota archaeon]
MIYTDQFHPKLGIIYGVNTKIEKLAKKCIGHLNNDGFCNACEQLDQKISCGNCRENLTSFAKNIYFIEQITKNIPQFIDNPKNYFPKHLPSLDYLLIFGIHRDLLVGLPEYLKNKKIKGVIIPIEDSQWVPPGLQKQVLEEFERWDIQAAFPRPFCTLNKEEDEYNRIGFNLTNRFDYISLFVDYFKIGKPLISLKLNESGTSIKDAFIVRSAPCGSTHYVLQKLKGIELKNRNLDLSLIYENISKAHCSYPCYASMKYDSLLNESILCIGDIIIKNAVMKALNTEIEKHNKLNWLLSSNFIT